MAKILATLIKGQHYHVNGITFTKGKEVEIEESLKDYLEDNSHFELNVVESDQEETSKQKGMVLKGRGAKNKQEGDK